MNIAYFSLCILDYINVNVVVFNLYSRFLLLFFLVAVFYYKICYIFEVKMSILFLSDHIYMYCLYPVYFTFLRHCFTFRTYLTCLGRGNAMLCLPLRVRASWVRGNTVML